MIIKTKILTTSSYIKLSSVVILTLNTCWAYEHIDWSVLCKNETEDLIKSSVLILLFINLMSHLLLIKHRLCLQASLVIPDIFTIHLFPQTCGTFQMLNTNNSNILCYKERKSIPIYDFSNYIIDTNMNVNVHITQQKWFQTHLNTIRHQRAVSEPTAIQCKRPKLSVTVIK